MTHSAGTVNPPPDAAELRLWAAQLRHDLAGNVIPWWQRGMFDPAGGLLPGRDAEGRILDAPCTAVLGARVLWSFAAVAARQPEAAGPERCVQDAWRWLADTLTDPVHGGVYWSIDAQGRPLADHKHLYAQAFAIYGLAACHRWQAAGAGRGSGALAQAMALFDRIETVAADPRDGGHFESFTRDWQPLARNEIAPGRPPGTRALNTALHVLESSTELLAAGLDARVAARVRAQVLLFVDRLWLPERDGFADFYGPGWQPLTDVVSWGHDAEAMWLLVRACRVLGDDALLARVAPLALRAADALLRHGLAADGSVLGEGQGDGRIADARRHWWCQAEAMVGLWDVWQVHGTARHARAAWRLWQTIRAQHIDAVGGDWHKRLHPDGRPDLTSPKAGPWECPYHHVRAELEMLERLPAAQAHG